MLPGIPGSARCVQRFDDSLDPAIRITYRISLRSSSLWEPRHPSLKVVWHSVVKPPRRRPRRANPTGLSLVRAFWFDLSLRTRRGEGPLEVDWWFGCVGVHERTRVPSCLGYEPASPASRRLTHTPGRHHGSCGITRVHGLGCCPSSPRREEESNNEVGCLNM